MTEQRFENNYGVILLSPIHFLWREFLSLRMHAIHELKQSDQKGQVERLEAEEGYLTDYQGKSDQAIFMLESDERIAGFSMVALEGEGEKRQLNIFDFYLLPDWREEFWRKRFEQALCRWGQSYGAVYYKVSKASTAATQSDEKREGRIDKFLEEEIPN